MECSSIGHLPRRNGLDPTGGRYFSLTRSGCSSKVQLLTTLTNISWPRGMSIWSVLLFMALLLTQPSDQRSLPEFKTDNLQTTELQTANLHIEVQNLQRTESLNFFYTEPRVYSKQENNKPSICAKKFVYIAEKTSI